MCTVSPLYPPTPHHRQKTVQVFDEKNLPVSGPAQFKPGLFKCRFLGVEVCMWFGSVIISTWRPCWSDLSYLPVPPKLPTPPPFPSSSVLPTTWSFSWLWTKDTREEEKKKEKLNRRLGMCIINVFTPHPHPPPPALPSQGLVTLWQSHGGRCLSDRRRPRWWAVRFLRGSFPWDDFLSLYVTEISRAMQAHDSAP